MLTHRFGAFLLDMTIALLLASPCLLVGGLSMTTSGAGAVCMGLFFMLAYSLLDLSPGGSVGRRVLRLRLIRADGGAASFASRGIRWLIIQAPLVILLLISIAWTFLPENGGTLLLATLMIAFMVAVPLLLVLNCIRLARDHPFLQDAASGTVIVDRDAYIPRRYPSTQGFPVVSRSPDGGRQGAGR